MDFLVNIIFLTGLGLFITWLLMLLFLLKYCAIGVQRAFKLVLRSPKLLCNAMAERFLLSHNAWVHRQQLILNRLISKDIFSESDASRLEERCGRQIAGVLGNGACVMIILPVKLGLSQHPDPEIRKLSTEFQGLYILMYFNFFLFSRIMPMIFLGMEVKRCRSQ